MQSRNQALQPLQHLQVVAIEAGVMEAVDLAGSGRAKIIHLKWISCVYKVIAKGTYIKNII